MPGEGLGWYKGIRYLYIFIYLYMSRIVLCEYSIRSNCWVLCFGDLTCVLRCSSAADSWKSWRGTVSMCRDSLWQEQTGRSILHTFITTPKTYIIIPRMFFFNILIWRVHILCWCVCTYVVCVAYQCRCLVVCDNIDWFAYADWFFYNFFSYVGQSPAPNIVGNFNMYPRLAAGPRYTRQTVDSAYASAGS